MVEFTRKDLLALTLDGLTQLANAGLVKRSVRDLESGQGPQISAEADGCIVATYADGTLTRLPPGKSPGDAHCTCPAGGMCRHRVALVLAYQQAAEGAGGIAERESGAAGEGEGDSIPGFWDPADIPPEAVDAMLVATTRNALQRLLGQPQEVRLQYGAVPTANLAMATVRFLVPHDLAYARCDCVAGQQCAHVALAVAAFRVGRQRQAQVVTLGGESAVPAEVVAGLRSGVLALVGRLLEEGVVGGIAAVATRLEVLRRAAGEAGATWLTLALEALTQQIEAYAARSARYAELEMLALVAEIYARTHVRGTAGSAALGVGEALETLMGSTRLVSLGARIRAEGREIRACVLLADSDTGTTLVFEKVFAPRESQPRLEVAAVPALRLAPGISVGALAKGQLLTAVAKRRADGLLTLGAGRGGKTALVPHAGQYALPVPLRVCKVDALVAEIREMAPALLRPRHRVREVHLFNVAEVLGHAFAPGEQRWEAAVELADEGGTLYLERSYDAGAPQALGVLFAAFEGQSGTLRQIAGPTRIEDGRLICEPWMLSADTLIVPDIDLPAGVVEPPLFSATHGPVALPEQTLRWLAEALHQGCRNLARDHVGRGAELAGQLAAAGYLDSAERLRAWLGEAPGDGHAARFAECAVWLLCLGDE